METWGLRSTGTAHQRSVAQKDRTLQVLEMGFRTSRSGLRQTHHSRAVKTKEGAFAAHSNFLFHSLRPGGGCVGTGLQVWGRCQIRGIQSGFFLCPIFHFKTVHGKRQDGHRQHKKSTYERNSMLRLGGGRYFGRTMWWCVEIR
jgi:hypothetical protein